ncbi:MAG: dTDP-4-dehydrorhamnose 3,5-epimerase [Clostridium sp.]|nr:dTDP-4-dehydrorhamnose 3,5-epimerase [Clostridium sp.]
MKYEFENLGLEGAYLIRSKVAYDNRGAFVKDFEETAFAEAGISFHCSESFFSISKKNVVRGMHFQIDNPQAKLVGVISGSVYDVVVDLRKNSDTFGKWHGAELSAENGHSFYVPRGFAHGFIALRDDTIMEYKCDGAYSSDTDTGIRFDDLDINIQWPIDDMKKCIMSDRDRSLMTLKEFSSRFGGL